jgi:farnesyl diphosphate synthase
MNETAGLISAWQEHFDGTLPERMALAAGAPGLLFEAMQYSALSGGKRMRPLLVYGSARALGHEPGSVDGIACAIEIIHAYSLIHDDLPAMDDDDLRRGRPTCHRAFDEATAILAGDALQALAFEILSSDPVLTRYPERQVSIINSVSQACGAGGMAGGQVLDLSAVGGSLSLEQLTTMHRLKTGALISVSATAPALLNGSSQDLVGRLRRYGDRVGLAFQIHDDILDVTGSTVKVGKSTQKDAAALKPTFPSILGLDESHRYAARLRDEALDEIRQFPGNSDCLEWLACYAISRES